MRKWYKKGWTEFEVQSLAYSILRKALWPKYLVRGEYFVEKGNKEETHPLSISNGCKLDIAIFTPFNEKNEVPKLVLAIEVKKGTKSISTKQGERYSKILGVPCIYIRGKEDAYEVLQLVKPYLTI